MCCLGCLYEHNMKKFYEKHLQKCQIIISFQPTYSVTNAALNFIYGISTNIPRFSSVFNKKCNWINIWHYINFTVGPSIDLPNTALYWE
jgi:hypothetical protein